MAKALPHEPTLYERDFFAWTQDQAARLRARAAFDNRGDIDWENAAEEIEDLGSSQRNEIESRLAVLLMHLLTWRFQPAERSNSGRATIAEQRLRLARRLRQNPRLRSYPGDILAEEYPLAKLRAVAETGLVPDAFPDACPFTIEDILDPDFLPEAA
ncbi:DUF29 domain-containing protein [Aureimonas sp. AU4]|uniref:DUF29 domain-containing protein n=1 Tax=Aureimonas sp. AU4 TaxID=1638163 RepID=UPI000784664F|nr:DUF29 domain-containing protein [Aureimonas sp. AU4]